MRKTGVQATRWTALLEDDTFSLEDARILYEQMQKTKILSKYTFPTKLSSDGYFHVNVADAGKKTGRGQIKAKTLGELEDKLYRFEQGIRGSTRKTFADIFTLAQEEKQKYIKNPEKYLSVRNTIGRNQTEYKRFFEGTEFEKRYIDEISKRDIEQICLINLERYDMRPKAFASMRSIMKMVFDMAYNEYLIADNPYTRVDFGKFKDMLAETESVARRVHTEEELEQMIAFIHEWQKKKPGYIPAYAIEAQILMGLRRGELPPLRWDEDVTDEYVEISREQITVKRNGGDQKEYFRIVSHTKNYKNRRYPVTCEVAEFMSRLRKVHDRYYPESEYLFPADTENGVITNNAVYGYYRRMCKSLGIEQSPGVIRGTHSFRRNAITKVVNRTGGDVLFASQIFGNTPEVARKHYYTGFDMGQARAKLEGME